MTIATPKFGIGASVPRTEDAAFITGRGRYTDEAPPEGTLHGYLARSPAALPAADTPREGVRHIGMPAAPARVREAVQGAR